MLIAAAGAVVSAADKLSGVTKGIESAVSGLFGPTATDKDRVADANALLERALAGDDAAVVALGYAAFEPRNGAPGDPRTPVDGKVSPQAVRDLAVSRLRQYVKVRGGLPASASQWATKLDAAIIAPRLSLVDATLGAVERGVATGTKDAAAERIGAAAGRAKPWLLAGGVVLALGAAWYFLRRR